MCSGALSLDARPQNCVSCALRCLHPVGPILFVPNGHLLLLSPRSNALSLDTCRSKLSKAAKSICFVERNQIRSHLGVERTQKVLVLSNENSGAPLQPPPPTPQRARLKHFDARKSSFTERNEISPRWPQWRRYRGSL